MKFTFEHLGTIDYAEVELGEFTIICGENNTGKTYITYAIYGFLKFWHEASFLQCLPQETRTSLWQTGSASISIAEVIEASVSSYVETLPSIFAARKQAFSMTKIKSSLFPPLLPESFYFAFTNQIPLKDGVELERDKEGHQLTIRLFGFDKKESPAFIDEDLLKDDYEWLTLQRLFKHPKPFIVSVERTGAAIFRNELDSSRSKLVDKIRQKPEDFEKLISQFSEAYVMPVGENIDYVRKLIRPTATHDSFLVEQHPDILTDFNNLLGGEYEVDETTDQVYFVPNAPKGKKKTRLTMQESASSVRSLLLIGFYLRHSAKPGDILMIDEPELNLHPKNQRRLARLLARLVNIGLKVFVTTHSDYLVKELNTLIMLNPDGKTEEEQERLKAIANKEHYLPEEWLSPEKVRLYVAKKDKKKKNTLVEATITPERGIEVDSFDTTIDEMNQIQEEILFS
jgi:AAA15 family ATPase/GTPase